MNFRSPTNISTSIHQRLKNVAHESGRTFNEVLQHYALERFLYRLSVSQVADTFVLKGALLLRAWDVASARPTRDIDLLGQTGNDVDNLKRIIRGICEIPFEDGLTFDLEHISAERIADQAEYQGIRIEFRASLGNAVIPMRVDVGFGDQVTPKPKRIDYPTLFDMPRPRLYAYPPETVIAEKLQIMFRFGMLNSRMKDYFDIWMLAQSQSFDGRTLCEAIRRTCERRDTPIESNPVGLSEAMFANTQNATQWKAFRRRLGNTEAPETFEELGDIIAAFLSPPISALVHRQSFHTNWSPSGPWTPHQ